MQPLSGEGHKIAHLSNPCLFSIQQRGNMRVMSLRVPEGSGKLVMFRTALSIVLELEVTVYLYTVLANDVQPL